MKAEDLFEQAVAEARAGRLDQATRLCLEILDVNPGHIQANLMLGIAAARSMREDEAIARLAVVLEQEPENAEALRWMSGALNRKGRFAEAVDYAQRAVAVRPDEYAAQLALGQAYAGLGRLEDSVAAFVSAGRLEPKREAAYRGLFQSLVNLGRRQEARSVLLELANHVPSPWCHVRLSEFALQFGWPEEAIRWAEMVPQGAPEEESALITLAAAFGLTGSLDKQNATFERLEAVNPRNRFVPMIRGFGFQSRGCFEEAEVEFRRSIELEPKLGESYQGITAGRRILAEDLPLVEQMEGVLAKGGLTADEAGPLHFALGKAYDDLGRYEEAMGQFVEANRVIRAVRLGSRPFDRELMERDVDWTIDLYTKEFLKKNVDERSYEPMPIVIAGAMRSGTTLLEQILSTHPHVGAAGEQIYWRMAARECVTFDPFDPEAGVHVDVIRKKAWQYIRQLRSLAPGKAYVTEKDPGNHRLFGIIHLALPESPLIQLKRNLADVALSMFTTYFQTAEEYVWDRSDIVFALKQHVRLEEHWRKVLPPDRFLEVEYEELVSNPEPTIRRLLEFCGLEWDDACLRSEYNDRAVSTPSFWQVRQPVNPRSVDRWRRYEPWLGPLAELVEY